MSDEVQGFHAEELPKHSRQIHPCDVQEAVARVSESGAFQVS